MLDDNYREFLKGLTDQQLKLQQELAMNFATKNTKELRMLKEELLRREHSLAVGDKFQFDGVEWTLFRLLPPVAKATKENVVFIERCPYILAWKKGASLSPFKLVIPAPDFSKFGL